VPTSNDCFSHTARITKRREGDENSWRGEMKILAKVVAISAVMMTGSQAQELPFAFLGRWTQDGVNSDGVPSTSTEVTSITKSEIKSPSESCHFGSIKSDGVQIEEDFSFVTYTIDMSCTYPKTPPYDGHVDKIREVWGLRKVNNAEVLVRTTLNNHCPKCESTFPSIEVLHR
jgi:hypothetical protein